MRKLCDVRPDSRGTGRILLIADRRSGCGRQVLRMRQAGASDAADKCSGCGKQVLRDGGQALLRRKADDPETKDRCAEAYQQIKEKSRPRAGSAFRLRFDILRSDFRSQSGSLPAHDRIMPRLSRGRCIRRGPRPVCTELRSLGTVRTTPCSLHSKAGLPRRCLRMLL